MEPQFFEGGLCRFLLPGEKARRNCVRLRQQSLRRSRSGDNQTVLRVMASEGAAEISPTRKR
jgi:hypothetical protein